jgi:hypothetical protein
MKQRGFDCGDTIASKGGYRPMGNGLGVFGLPGFGWGGFGGFDGI